MIKRNKLIISMLSFIAIAIVSGSIQALAVSLEEPGTGRQFTDYYIINGEIIPDGAPKVKQGITFVQGRRTAEALGVDAEYDSSNHILTVKNNNDIYTFKNNDYFYMKNDKKVYFKVVKQNGIEAPINTRISANYNQNDIEVPLSFFTKELGFSDKFTVDSNWCLTLGTGVSLDLGRLTPTSDFLTGVKANKEKTVEQGWVCPVLKSVSVDNVNVDSKTLIKELDFVENGSTSASYKVDGSTVISVGPFATGENASHFSGIFFPAHNSSFQEVRSKVEKILPQVFKFYFPNNYEKAMEIMENVYKTGVPCRYKIDGRDVLFKGDNIMFSKVNDSLKGYMGSDYEIKGVIGTSYNVKTDNSGYWTQSGGSQMWLYEINGIPQKGWQKIGELWYHFDNDGVMQTGWFNENEKWYYLNNVNGHMETNTTINGYKIGPDGVWIQ